MNLFTPPDQGPTELPFRRGHKYSTSTPANMQAYANRPLPPLPVSSSPSPARAKTPQPRERAESLPAFAYQGSFPINRRSAGTRGGTSTSGSRKFFSLTSPPSSATSNPHNTNSISSTWSSRSSQQKVHQLTGVDIDVMDDQSFRSGSIDSAASSMKSYAKMDDMATCEAADYHLVPVLETDVEESSSRGSSWGPLSPALAVVPPPLKISKQQNRDVREGAYSTTDDHLTQMYPDGDVIHPWGSAQGQFSDYEAAGEYHEFTAQLASRGSRQAMDSMSGPMTPPKKKRSSLSLAFSAASRFRRRELSQNLNDGTTSAEPQMSPKAFTEQSQQKSKSQPQLVSGVGRSPQLVGPSWSTPPTPTIAAVVTAPPPRPSPAPPLMSAWDSDTEDEDSHVMSSLKDWFASRASDDGKLHKRTPSGQRTGSRGQSATAKQDQMPEAVVRPKDRQAQMQMEKTAKRRQEQRRSQLKLVPQGIMVQNLHH